MKDRLPSAWLERRAAAFVPASARYFKRQAAALKKKS